MTGKRGAPLLRRTAWSQVAAGGSQVLWLDQHWEERSWLLLAARSLLENHRRAWAPLGAGSPSLAMGGRDIFST